MNPNNTATKTITLTETMEALCVKIENTFSQGKENEKLACLHTSKSIYFYKNCGISLSELLKNFKEQKHTTKEFDEYVEEKFGIKPRMRQRYVQLADNERTKDADEEFFSKMINPTLTNVIKALSFSDDDWEKVINGDDTPFESKFKTNDEKEVVLKNEFEKAELINIDFEKFKVYFNNSKADLINVIDSLISESNKEDNEHINEGKEEELK